MYPLLASIVDQIFALPTLYLILWTLLAVLTAALGVLMRTPWGRERPTHRYVLVSIIAHLALICLATTVRFMSTPAGEEAAAPIRVRIVMQQPALPTEAAPVEPPPEVETPAPLVEQFASEEPLIEPPEAITDAAPEASPKEFLEEPLDAPPLMAETALAEAPPAEPRSESPTPAEVEQPAPEPTPAVESQLVESEQVPSPTIAQTTPFEPPPPVEPLIESPIAPPTPVTPIEQVVAVQPPTAYTAREVDERLQIVEQEGGSRATEDAVRAALAWLASAQSRDGRWDADRWSAGRETRALGHDRRGAGARADTGVTGLALLALMGAGHTHQPDSVGQVSPYADTVRRGLEFLLRTQTNEGGLTGDAAVYAQTYCHSMATFALAEAYATTEDERLASGVRRAVDFLVARQDRSGGGWRYKPGDEGDMSQMGWIIMALRSAELAGIEVPPTVWSSIERFVRSTRRGAAGGLACYQPRGGVSRTMTAESMYCRQILGWPTAGTPASDEAINHILGRLPGQGKANFYFWYYAALALHHHRNSDQIAQHAWRTWNTAMSSTLVASQAPQGPNAGSWNANTLWGGYGGRVYATAMAAMCLEVYYRYDAAQVARDPWIAARPGGRYR